MPRQCLTAAERSALLAFPTEKSELIRLYTFSEQDLSVIKQRRGDANRLGFAVLLCALRYPGQALSAVERPPDSFLAMVAGQLGIDERVWAQYAEREETRREHLSELRAFLGLTPFGIRQFHQFARWLADLAMQTDKGVVLATALVQELRREKVVLPPINVIERVCALAITRANRKIYLILAGALNDRHRVLLEGLLRQPIGSTSSTLAWLRQPPGAPSAKHLLEHLQRLKTIQALDLPEGVRLQIHQNRWLKLAREGGQMTVQHLRDLETSRRYATLLAILLEAKATLIDQPLDLHDRMIGALFNCAKRRHAEEFQQSGEAIHEKVRLYWRIGEALLQARQSGIDPFPAIEAIIPWEAFVQSVTEAQRLARVEGFDYLHRISEGYTQIRRYAPDFLNAFRFKAAPAAQPILEAIETLKTMDTDGLRKVPADSPTDFIRKRWKALVFTDSGMDRRFYELCALSELKNALRSGDIWVQGSRQFKDFDEYLIPSERFSVLREANRLSLFRNQWRC
jgi:Domain of unknown function (DUF4158)